MLTSSTLALAIEALEEKRKVAAHSLDSYRELATIVSPEPYAVASQEKLERELVGFDAALAELRGERAGVDNSKPLPCPYCGATVEVEHVVIGTVDEWYIINCTCDSYSWGHATEAETIAAWNKRTAPATGGQDAST